MSGASWQPSPILRFAALMAVLPAAGLPVGPVRTQDKPDFARWEKEIAAFERQDRERPPPPGAVLFVGSSSIRLWDLPKSFPGVAVINRGFGGSQLADAVHFVPRIVLRYRPRVVVLYAGDNDTAAGKGPRQVADDFRAFARAVHKELPGTRIVYVSIKPSPQRWPLWDRMRKANELIEAACKQDERLTFVDVARAMLGKDAKPRPELFAKDGLHLKEKGYALWATALKPHLGSGSPGNRDVPGARPPGP
jgi:lysophospholipase L1-like esterase